MDSAELVDRLAAVDPQFVTLCKTLFGDMVDPADVWEYSFTPDGVSKMSPAPSDLSVPTATRAVRAIKRNAGKAAGPILTGTAAGVIANQFPQHGEPHIIRALPAKQGKVAKAKVSFWTEISKVNAEKRQVFGWASIVEVNGEPVVDRQGDIIAPEEIEKAAYDYVVKSRKGGSQHRRDGDEPFHASDMIESIVFTDDKIAKMGLPDDFPRGWWVGYKVHDDETWEDIKAGKKTGFSIHGRGKREEVGV